MELTLKWVRKEMERRLEEGLAHHNRLAKEKIGIDCMPAVKSALRDYVTDEDIEESMNRGLSKEEWMHKFEISMENLLGEAMIIIACKVNDISRREKEKNWHLKE